jgi:hypothetical protein
MNRESLFERLEHGQDPADIPLPAATVTTAFIAAERLAAHAERVFAGSDVRPHRGSAFLFLQGSRGWLSNNEERDSVSYAIKDDENEILHAGRFVC